MNSTATSPQNHASFRKQIGSALWLWELLVMLIPATWEGKSYVFVAGGQTLSDIQLGIWLGAKVSTIAAWRRKLKTAGLLDWIVRPGVGRVYIASPLVGKEFFENEKPNAISGVTQLAPQPIETRKADTEPLASRFVQ
jgi:hypothetical protein